MDRENLEQELIARARRGLSPSPDDQARIHRATLAAISTYAANTADAAAGAPGGAENDPALSQQGLPELTGSVARRLPAWARRFLVGVVIAAPAYGIGYFMGRRADREPPPIAAVAAPSAVAVPLAPSLEATTLAPPPALPEREITATPERAESKPARAKSSRLSLEEELAVMRRVELALRTAQPGMALNLLEELDQVAPGGTLLEERRAAFVRASCQTDPSASAELEKTFARNYPRSVYLRHVQQSCRTPGSTSNPRSEQRRAE